MLIKPSPAVVLAEEVLQELIWLSKDREPKERKRRSARPVQEQARLEHALQPFELLKLVLKLKSERAFSHARQILTFLRTSQVTEPELQRVYNQPRSIEPDSASITGSSATESLLASYTETALEFLSGGNLQLKLAQLHSLCTYKDNSLSVRTRLESALEILNAADDLATTKDQETLGQAGAIHKRLADLDGKIEHLEQSLQFYRRGYEVGIESDFGYTALNTAYVLDLIAKRQETGAWTAGFAPAVMDTQLTAAEGLRKEANQIRWEIVARLWEYCDQEAHAKRKGEWWFVVTLAEAYYGLGLAKPEYLAKAEKWLKIAARIPQVSDWEFETTARQLVTLLSLRYEEDDSPESEWQKAFKFLRPFLHGKEVGLRAALRGKVGLSLSGGGFRAAFFHIGVLAKLAELDMLRNIEVISCVSAGSIIGAHYYLELRELLQSKKDGAISREDYIDVVSRVESRFLKAVQSNIRTRLGAEILTNLKTVFLPNYTRTERIGELLETLIYSKVGKTERHKDLRLEELNIFPLDEDPATFVPVNGNWRRAAKVPALVINATTLNTGHNWQFTTSWMGEPATGITAEIDRAPRLRRVRYSEAPEGYNGFLLRRAVAASTCTLGFMEPVTLKGLYPDMTVRLVDGVFQGGQAAGPLLEHDCDVLLVSDASGQMHAQKNPGQGVLDIGVRSSHILFGHLRARYYETLESNLHSSLLRGLMFVHLKKELDAETLFAEAKEPIVTLDDSRASTTTEITSYGVLKEVQKRLAEIRTDIDAFSDTEAYALMMSGYLMTGHEFIKAIKDYPISNSTRPPWRFLAIEEPMKTVGNQQLIQLLDAARRQLFKFWAMSPVLRSATMIFAYVCAVILLLVLFFLSNLTTIPARSFFLDLVYVGFITLTAYFAWLVITKRKTVSQIMLGLGMSTIGFLFARLVLHILDPWYLAKGRIANIKPSDKTTATEDQTWLESFLNTISSRPIAYLSQKANVGGTVSTIRRIVDHARVVEAIARLFEDAGYETSLYPRDERINPLRLSLDIYAQNNEQGIFTSVRTRRDISDLDTWTAASELNAACFALEGENAAEESNVEARLVLVDTPADKKLVKYVDRVRRQGLKIHVIFVSVRETQAIAAAQRGDRLLEEVTKKLQIARISNDHPRSEPRSLNGGPV